MAEEKEFYILRNVTKNMYFKGFDKSKPEWIPDEEGAKVYEEMEALGVQRRLECMYSPHQKVVLIEKIR